MPNHNGELGEYEQTVRDLSERIVLAQKPIRILDALKWGPEVEEHFMQSNCKSLPNINADYYQQNNALSFDILQKKAEFHEIERMIRKKLGQYSGVGSVMSRMCNEYIRVVEMLRARGTPYFTEISQELYGSSEDAFHAGAPTLKDLANIATNAISKIKNKAKNKNDLKTFTSAEVVTELQKRLSEYFYDEKNIRVELSDGIIADAAAGADKIKIRNDLKFSLRDIRTFEIHEGWVHLGTTLNGAAQPVCTFLSKGPPSSTVTQEGLAIITEIFNFSSHPGRIKRLTNRINAVNMAEEGANFYDVFAFFREQGLSKGDSYQSSVRVFRGSTPDGGPYTKDLSYSKGFILIYNFMRLAVQRGLIKRIPMLFVGKTTLEDLHVISDLLDEGIVVQPKYLPPQFKDLAAVSAWMIYSLFLNKLDLSRLARDFKGFLH